VAWWHFKFIYVIDINIYIIYLQGWFLPEAAHPYYVLSPSHPIDFASPAGPNPEVDESSVKVTPIQS
jgi:hypothetical protein